jgi:probable rRNA maturation factor
LLDEQTSVPVDRQRLVSAVSSVLGGEGVAAATISVAVIDDAAIHELNRQFLAHDEPTDVLSFVLERQDDFLEGEIVVSGDTACRSAAEFGWPAADELLLYVIHGALHLAGYDDLDPASQLVMRDRERHYLDKFGLQPRYAPPGADGETA